jgi:hypothetical protein
MYCNTEVWSQKSTSKDTTEFYGSGFSHIKHTLHPRREWAPSDDLRLQVPVGNPTLIGLELPLTALNGITGRRRNILTYTQTKKQQEQKIEWLRSTRLIRRDPKAMNSSHANASKWYGVMPTCNYY